MPPPTGEMPADFSLSQAARNVVPGLRCLLRIEACLLEQVLVVDPDHRQRIPAHAVGMPIILAEQRRLRRLEDVGVHQAVERLHIAEPDALHMVDAVPEVLDVGRIAGRRGGLELRGDDGGVLQHRLHGRRRIVLHRVVDKPCRPGSSCSPHHHMVSSVAASARQAGNSAAGRAHRHQSPRTPASACGARDPSSFAPHCGQAILFESAWSRLKCGHQPAIDHEQLPGHIAAVRRGEENHRAGNVFGIAGATQRNLAAFSHTIR